jgi:uncharacterized protein (TIGR02117 family)
MNNIVIFPVIFFFLHTSPKLSVSAMPSLDEQVEIVFNDSLHTIYFIKQRWHTAIVFHTEEVDSTILPEIKYFSGAELIDIGWGDEAFYQHPDFDWDLAYHALFYATPSTLRIEGIFISKEKYFDVSEIVAELRISTDQLKILLNYISDTILRGEEGKSEILSTQYLDRVYFLKAKGEYHLFNTCNTWLAEGLNSAGIEIEDDIVLTEQFFNELAIVGRIIKVE